MWKKTLLKDSKKYLEKNSGKISIAFFLGGFLLDNLTLQRIDSLAANLVLLSYLFLALFFIWIYNWGDYKGYKKKIFYKIYSVAPYVIQFSFGALFSGYVIFYTRSSSFFDSWPFLLLLYFLFVANEKLKNQYEKFNIQIIIFYFALLSFSIFYIPIMFKSMNYWIFIFSEIISIILIFLILKLFFRYIPNLKKFNKKIIFSISIILIFFNLLYFFHLLPPVPLSVKEINIYHYVGRDKNYNYTAADEKRKWYVLSDWFEKTIHWTPGDCIYAYASIFAPTDFKTDVKFIWYKKNSKGNWIKKSSFKQHLVGGRDNGFRTKSKICNVVSEGGWKIFLISNEGAVIDRMSFEVKKADSEYPLFFKKLK